MNASLLVLIWCNEEDSIKTEFVCGKIHLRNNEMYVCLPSFQEETRGFTPTA